MTIQLTFIDQPTKLKQIAIPSQEVQQQATADSKCSCIDFKQYYTNKFVCAPLDHINFTKMGASVHVVHLST